MMQLASLLDPTNPVFWFVAGALLFGLELLMPAFLALGFGIAAWVMAALLTFAIPDGALSGPFILMIWSLLSAASWVALRVIFRNRYSGTKPEDSDINEY